MRESTVIQGWVDQGIEKGIEKGRLEQARQTLERMVARRFGAVPAGLRQLIEATTEVEALQRAAEALFDAADADLLLR